MEDLAENFMGRGRKEIFNSKVGHTVKVAGGKILKIEGEWDGKLRF